jgi:hypothetical protein
MMKMIIVVPLFVLIDIVFCHATASCSASCRRQAQYSACISVAVNRNLRFIVNYKAAFNEGM